MSTLAHEFRLIRLERWAATLCLPLLGLLQAWALADGQGRAHGGVQILALAGFFLFLDGARSLRQAAWRGWWFATWWLSGVCWWLFISMHVYGGLPAPLAVAGVVALAAALALYYGVAASLYWWARGLGFMASALLFAACWTLAELARGQWLTGFPWGAIGYAHVDSPLAWLARWAGVYGVGAIAAALAALLALCVVAVLGYIFGRFISAARLPVTAPRMVSAYAWLAVLLVAILAGGHWQRAQFAEVDAQLAARKPVTLALLQGNIPIAEKFDPGTGVLDSLRWYGEQFTQRKEALVIAPETAIPVLPQDLPPRYLEIVTAPYRSGDQALLTGLPLGDTERGYTNSVLGVRPAGAGATDSSPADYVYSKSHLVPFGEFVPPLFQWFNDMMDIPLDSFRRGAVVQPSFAWQGERFAPNICYEDLFGEELARRFSDPQQAPTVLVNFSNIGWFGDGAVIDQHLHISRMRTLELERPMVRATNTGATAIIDHRGRVMAKAPRAGVAVLSGAVVGNGHDGSASSITPYAHWASRLGLLPLWALALLTVASCAVVGTRLPRMYHSR